MNWLLWILGLLMFGLALHLFVRVKVVQLAKVRTFFASPEMGRIMAIIRGGDIVAYIANLKGLTVEITKSTSDGKTTKTVGYKEINEKTGEVVVREKMSWHGLFQSIYGVRFIGLDKVQEYNLDITRIGSNGEVINETVTAHSLHYSGVYDLILEGDECPETKEGTPVSLRLKYTTITHHAGHCLKYKSKWLMKMESAVKAGLRDFVGKNELRQLLEMQNEKPDNPNDGLVAFIRSLNVGTVGNSGLIETLGQEIIDINLESIEMAPEMAEALQEKKLTEERMAAELLQSQQEVAIAENDAKKKVTLGEAENKVAKGKLEAVGGVEGLIGLAKWDAIKELKDLKGTLFLGDHDTKPVVQLPATKGGAT